MFGNMTFEKILGQMLVKIPDTFDKREGSIIYDALAPAAVELTKAYIEMDRVLNEAFADTASREFLIRRAAESGITPEDSTYAKIMAEITGSFVLRGGERFNLDELNYIYEGEQTIRDENKYYILRCETKGTIGNIDNGRLIPIDNMPGLESAEVIGIALFGEDEEDTEVFRQRYFELLKGEAYGGNITDYKVKTKALDGVGGVRVIPVWNGGGTVKLIITDSEYSGGDIEELVNRVAQAVDPPNNSGKGYGIAPIGHKVTVVAATPVEIKVSISCSDYNAGIIKTAVKEHFRNINKTFENGAIVIDPFLLGTEIVSTKAISDINSIEINNNGKFERVVLNDTEIIDIEKTEVVFNNGN